MQDPIFTTVLKIMSMSMCAYVCDTSGRAYRNISWMHQLLHGKLNLNANEAIFLDSR